MKPAVSWAGTQQWFRFFLREIINWFTLAKYHCQSMPIETAMDILFSGIKGVNENIKNKEENILNFELWHSAIWQQEESVKSMAASVSVVRVFISWITSSYNGCACVRLCFRCFCLVKCSSSPSSSSPDYFGWFSLAE